MYSSELFAESFAPFSIYRTIARFILAKNLTEVRQSRHISLIFITSDLKELKPNQICLKIRQTLQSMLSSPDAVEISYSLYTQDLELPATHAKYTVRLLYLPLEYLPTKSQTSRVLPPLLENACKELAKQSGTDNCSVIFWYPQYSRAHDLETQPQLADSLAAVFGKIRFAKIVAQTASIVAGRKCNLRMLGDLLALLAPAQLAYLLKGWRRPELKAKGLTYHPAFGLLAEQEIEDIICFCEELKMPDNSVRWAFIPHQTRNKPKFKDCQPHVSPHVPSSNALVCLAGNLAASG